LSPLAIAAASSGPTTLGQSQWIFFSSRSEPLISDHLARAIPFFIGLTFPNISFHPATLGPSRSRPPRLHCTIRFLRLPGSFVFLSPWRQAGRPIALYLLRPLAHQPAHFLEAGVRGVAQPLEDHGLASGQDGPGPLQATQGEVVVRGQAAGY